MTPGECSGAHVLILCGMWGWGYGGHYVKQEKFTAANDASSGRQRKSLLAQACGAAVSLTTLSRAGFMGVQPAHLYRTPCLEGLYASFNVLLSLF